MTAARQQNPKPYLQKLLDGDISEKELAELVQLSRSIVQAYFEYIRNSIFQLCRHQGLTMTDVAYDCLGEAFVRDETDRFSRLEDFVESLDENLETIDEREVFLAYKSFLMCLADAQLARLFAQSDPAGAKIHRNIRDCVKQSGFFCIKKDFRGKVLMPRDCEASEHRAPFPPDELEAEFRQTVNRQATLGHLLNALHDILVKQSAYRRSVPVVEVVQIFRRYYQAEAVEPDDGSLPSREGLSEFEIRRIRQHVELALKEKILLTYLARGKIDRQQAEALARAFEDMIADWCSGEESQTSLYGYVSRYVSMDEATYESTMRPKMEYLLKIVREEFAARLMKDI